MRPLAASLALVALLGAACDSGGRVAGVPGAAAVAPAEPVASSALPETIAGLRLQEEDVNAQLAEVGDEAFVTSLQLWSLREGDRLRATIQLARFAPDARPEEAAFRERVATQIGSGQPRLRLVGDDRVFVNSGNEQIVYTWFRDLYFLTLTVSADYPTPRALVRAALTEVRP